MKQADKPIIIINGDNNKVFYGERTSHITAAIVIMIGIVAGAAILAVSHCCPELLAEFVRWIISTAINS